MSLVIGVLSVISTSLLKMISYFNMVYYYYLCIRVINHPPVITIVAMYKPFPVMGGANDIVISTLVGLYTQHGDFPTNGKLLMVGVDFPYLYTHNDVYRKLLMVVIVIHISRFSIVFCKRLPEASGSDTLKQM